MAYSDNQISKAKAKYNNFLSYETANNYDISTIGINEAEMRAQNHNDIVNNINDGR